MLSLKRQMGPGFPYTGICDSRENFKAFYEQFKSCVTIDNRATYFQQALLLIDAPYYRYLFATSFRTYCCIQFGPASVGFLDKHIRKLRREAGVKKRKFKITVRSKNGLCLQEGVFSYNGGYNKPIVKKR